MKLRRKNRWSRASVFAAVAFVASPDLFGCAEVTAAVDPLAVDGRDGGTQVTYPSLMRVGTAARAGGDYANAVAIFRRAAELAPGDPTPLVAAGETLRDMGRTNEAIVAFNSALARNAHSPLALQGLAKTYLSTGRPELAAEPLATAYQDTPNDPKVILLLGVSADYTGKHRDAQAFYKHGLELQPNDRALILDLALSLALSEDYDAAVAQLRPIAAARDASPRERQTLALIYGLKGDRRNAAEYARLDLDATAVEHNLAYYETLRHLPPDARSKAVISADNGRAPPRPS